ncbi:hypothetical protein GCM10027169_40200 [Gordonia jinhuaensis]
MRHDRRMDVVTASVAAWLCLLSVTDLVSLRLPNVVTVPGCLAVAASSVPHPHVGLIALAVTVPYLLAWWFGGCGGGDVKLVFVLGALAGDLLTAMAVVVVAAVVTVCVVVGMRVCRHGGRCVAAHGPALAVAAAALIF